VVLYDFRLAEREPTQEDYAAKVKVITQVVVEVVAQVLPPTRQHQAEALAPSLLATMHGLLLNAFRLLSEEDPLGAALARVHEAIAEDSEYE
jgi:hypothetical protein